jgi:hypothetical protein
MDDRTDRLMESFNKNDHDVLYYNNLPKIWVDQYTASAFSVSIAFLGAAGRLSHDVD